MNNNIGPILSTLNRSGFRTTNTRRKIVEAIYGLGKSFTVEELIQKLPDSGRATIFRNVKVMRDLGIICQVILDDGRSVYQLDFESSIDSYHHHHLICSNCKNIQEFNSRELENILNTISDEMTFQIDTHRLELFGYCSECVKFLSLEKKTAN